YCPEAVDSNYIMVTSINLNKPDEQAKVTATLGAAGNIYCSTDNLYVAGYNYGSGDSEQGKTVIYKFSLKDGEVTYKSSGKVSGGILNQFSMDESNGYFRVATTEQNYTKGNSSQLNNLFILDSDMKLSGSLENLAQGEKIYSVRFMGDRAYMVTYRTTDPLFVIDLKSPSAPKVLGELKIPGYSNYLHPYDENHIIGFGKDAEVVGEGTSTERAYYQGMKLAMFDVTDVNNPKLMFKTGIGDRGTDSQLLYDHKALLFSKEKNLLAFPVRVAEIADKSTVNKAAYGETTFIGAYVYNIDLQSGFTLKGKITHAEAGGDIQDNAKEIPYDFSIQRILYIDNNLYTVSDKNIKANSIKDLAEIGSLK
ncbi:MAG: beta-propeller domain-containing protein, partial [Bacillota bacterium]|nr:beta-propeller domain-containing protein [Bacillota bacterium]